MTKPTHRQEQRVAYHEAGHAVVNWDLGLGTSRASIRPGRDGSLGHVLNYKIPKDFDPNLLDEYVVRRRFEPRIIGAFAGVIAERRFTGHRHNWIGASVDMHNADELILHCVGGDPGAVFTKYHAWLWERARRSVEFHWPKIEAVAAALLEREVLTGAQIRAIIIASLGLTS